MIRLISAVIAIAVTTVGARAQAPCADATPCQLASALIEGILERGGALGGRQLYIDMRSFSQIGPLFSTTVVPESVATRIGRPFRTDVEVTTMYTPSPNHNARWGGGDPYVIQLDSVKRDRDRVSAFVNLRWNIRQAGHPNATAVFGYLVDGEYVLEAREGRWVLVSARRVGPVR